MEGTIHFVVVLPFPWPPPRDILIFHHDNTNTGETIRLVAKSDGKSYLDITSASTFVSFVSQPIVVEGNRPRPVQGVIQWDAQGCSMRLSRQDLLPDRDDIVPFVLPPIPVPPERSFENLAAVTACAQWITNRKAKFPPKAIRDNRRRKTASEEAETLRSSILRLREFRQGLLTGKQFLLGTIAGELRALVYWPPARDSLPDKNWSPLLLRMANKAELPLPVYAPPDIPQPPIVGEAVWHLSLDAPHINAVFPNDAIFDLQENLKRGVLRLGVAPGRTIIAADLIKELAHTLGAAHYDEDASEFVDAMQKMIQEDADQIDVFICNMAETVASLSEWVLSELDKRKLTT